MPQQLMSTSRVFDGKNSSKTLPSDNSFEASHSISVICASDAPELIRNSLALFSFVLFLLSILTIAPDSQKNLAASKPIPVEPPETSIFLPLKDPFIIKLVL